MNKQITEQYIQEGEPLKVITLSGKVEKLIHDSVQQTEHKNYLVLEPSVSQQLIQAIDEELKKLSMTNQTPVILCSPAIRMYVRDLTERFFPHVAILSYNELDAKVEVQSVGVVNLH